MSDLVKHQEVADSSIKLIGQLKDGTILEGFKIISGGMTHMVSVIRWNQMELALLRTLEDHLRNNDDPDGEQEATLLSRLDDLRADLRAQQEAELQTVELKEIGGQ